MKPVTRRSFLVTGSAGALGVAGAAAIGTRVAAGGSQDDQAEPSAQQIAALSDPAVLHILNARSGEVELLRAEESIVFTDKSLVARVLRATR